MALSPLAIATNGLLDRGRYPAQAIAFRGWLWSAVPSKQGGGWIADKRVYKAHDDAQRKRRAVEQALEASIAEAWDKANGIQREEIREAIPLPAKPARQDFASAAKEIYASRQALDRLETLSLLSRIIEQQERQAEETRKRNAAMKYRQELEEWIRQEIEYAIALDEEDIEALLVY